MPDDPSKENPDNSNDNDKTDGESHSDSQTKVSLDDVRTIVREELQKLLPGNGESDKSGGKTDAKDSGEDGKPPRVSLRQVEEHAKRTVESEVSRVLGELEHKKEHESLRTAPKPPEAPPVKQRRLQRVLWGEK